MKKPMMKKEDLDKEYFIKKIKKKDIDLNKIGNLYYPELNGMLEVVGEKACALYPNKDWKEVKLVVLQSLVNWVAIKLTSHLKLGEEIEKDYGLRLDGDKVLDDWLNIMLQTFKQLNIKSDIVEIQKLVEREGKTIH